MNDPINEAELPNDQLTPADVITMPLADFERRFGFRPDDKLEKYMYAVTGRRLTLTVRLGIESGIVGDPPDVSKVGW